MRKKRRIRRALQYEVFLLPALLTFTAFTVFPLLETLLYSFTDFDGVLHTYNFVGLKNYAAVFRDDVMKQALFNTLFYTFFTVILINGISAGCLPGQNPKDKDPGTRNIFLPVRYQRSAPRIHLDVYSVPAENRRHEFNPGIAVQNQADRVHFRRLDRQIFDRIRFGLGKYRMAHHG